MSIRGLNKFKDLSSMGFHDVYQEKALQSFDLYGNFDSYMREIIMIYTDDRRE